MCLCLLSSPDSSSPDNGSPATGGRLRRSHSRFGPGLATSALLVSLLHAELAFAAECGEGSPDYTAVRTVSVGGKTFTAKVSVSGTRQREEALGEPSLVTLRLPDGVYVYDPRTKTGTKIPPPPLPPKQQTRKLEDRRSDGGKVVRLQFLAEGQWRDLSTTVCNAEGVMTAQDFKSFDPNGRLVQGHITQSGVNVGPTPASLFLIPADVKMKPPGG